MPPEHLLGDANAVKETMASQRQELVTAGPELKEKVAEAGKAVQGIPDEKLKEAVDKANPKATNEERAALLAKYKLGASCAAGFGKFLETPGSIMDELAKGANESLGFDRNKTDGPYELMKLAAEAITMLLTFIPKLAEFAIVESAKNQGFSAEEMKQIENSMKLARGESLTSDDKKGATVKQEQVKQESNAKQYMKREGDNDAVQHMG